MKWLGFLTLGVALSACSGGGPRKFTIDSCKSNFLNDHKMDLKGYTSVDLDNPDKSVSAVDLKISNTEIFIFDQSRDIRLRIVQPLPEKTENSKPVESQYKVACASGTGLNANAVFNFEIPVVDRLQVAPNGKSEFSTKTITVDWRPRSDKGMLEVIVSDSSEKKQGSLKAVYSSFKDVQQLYFYGNDQQIRNSMRLEKANERNSSASTVEIRTTQIYQTVSAD